LIFFTVFPPCTPPRKEKRTKSLETFLNNQKNKPSSGLQAPRAQPTSSCNEVGQPKLQAQEVWFDQALKNPT